ncbi:DUF2339 domain-containing protein [Paenibacillus pasadenensis]|uniref:DUF2339 domain-containing protein n=1 Tax=Paenibacillus pasadenensis TaxID=217090 RepID=UPI00203CE40B
MRESDQLAQRVEQLEQEVRELRRQVHRFGQLLLNNEQGKAGHEVNVQQSAGPSAPESELTGREQKAGLQGAEHSSSMQQAGLRMPQQADREALSAAPGMHGSERPAAPVKPPQQQTDWEHVIARVWLPRIFMIVLLLGVLWGFLAAVSAGYITPGVRCLLGIAASAAMLIAGARWMRQGSDALGKVLLGGGNGVLVLTLFAAHMLYGFIGAGTAVLLYTAAVALFVATALRYRSQALLAAAAAAGALVPFLVSSDEPNLALLLGYESLFASAILLISWRNEYRMSYVISYALLLPAVLIASMMSDSEVNRWVIVGALLLHHLLQYGLSLKDAAFASRPERFGLLFASFAINAGLLRLLLGPIEFRWTVAILALVYLGSAFMRRSAGGKIVSLYAIIATFGVALLVFAIASSDYLGATLLVQGILSLYLGIKLHSHMQQAAGGLVLLIGALVVLEKPIEAAGSAATASWVILLAVWTALYFLLRPLRPKQMPAGPGPLLLWSGGVLLLIFLTQLTLALADELAPDNRSLVLSAVWVAYALSLIVLGLWLTQSKVRMAGIVLLFLTLLKVIFVDLPGVSVAVRAVLFIGLGAVGILVSRFVYRKQKE